jgi:hypothetical protein
MKVWVNQLEKPNLKPNVEHIGLYNRTIFFIINFNSRFRIIKFFFLEIHIFRMQKKNFTSSLPL